jgi:hypothetical protein
MSPTLSDTLVFSNPPRIAFNSADCWVLIVAIPVLSENASMLDASAVDVAVTVRDGPRKK